MTTNFYPFPSAPSQFKSVHPRQLLPLHEPPASLLLYPPVLPPEALARNSNSTSTSISIDDGTIYTLSTHVVPAAYPRSTPFVPIPSDAASLLSNVNPAGREERKLTAKKVTQGMISLKDRQIKGEFPPDQRENLILWNCVNRYYRTDANVLPSSKGTKSITLLLLHANGFPKETWEPFLKYLTSELRSRTNGMSTGSVSIDEIWAFEATQHGDAVLINEDKLGSLYDWSDNARDVLQFLTRHLPSSGLGTERSTSQRLPVHLPRVPDDVEKNRLQKGFVGEDERTLVAIGHSLGGATAALAALTLPQFFSQLILVDPVIVPPYVNRTRIIYDLALGAVQRRHEWASREEARRSFAASSFFAAWDPAVLDTYVEFGLTLVDASSARVKLKMTGIQEAAVFVESRAAHEVFERLKDLDPHIALHFVMAGKGSWITGSEAGTCDIVWRRPINSTNSQIASSEHLIVQQAPKELAREVITVLERTFGAGNTRQARL